MQTGSFCLAFLARHARYLLYTKQTQASAPPLSPYSFSSLIGYFLVVETSENFVCINLAGFTELYVSFACVAASIWRIFVQVITIWNRMRSSYRAQ